MHPGALGDVVLAVPALRALRAAVPDHRLVLAAQPRIAALLAALGVADAALDLDALGLDALFADDTARSPRLPAADRVVCWMGSRDPAFVRRLRAVAPGAAVVPSVGEVEPVWAHLLATVSAPDGDWCAPITVAPAVAAAGAALLRAAGWDGRQRLVIAHPGSGGAAKRWAVEGFAAALERVPPEVMVAIHQGPADAMAAGALAARCGAARLLHEPPLPALAGALAHAAAYVGNDSGVSHLAAAVGTPAVLLFAAANAKWRPWPAAARVLTVRGGETCDADVRAVGDEIARLVR